MPSRHLASLLAMGLLLAAADARAQGSIVTPTPGPSVPGYAPPGVYAPYGGYAPPYATPYAPYGAPPPSYVLVPGPAPYPPMRRNSPAMMGVGVTLIALGGVGLVAGATFLAAGSQTTEVFPPCPANATDCGPIVQERNPGFKSAGIGLMVGSVAAIGVGIPLLVIGARRVPYAPEAAPPAQSLLPDVRVGAGALSARWSF